MYQVFTTPYFQKDTVVSFCLGCYPSQVSPERSIAEIRQHGGRRPVSPEAPDIFPAWEFKSEDVDLTCLLMRWLQSRSRNPSTNVLLQALRVTEIASNIRKHLLQWDWRPLDQVFIVLGKDKGRVGAQMNQTGGRAVRVTACAFRWASFTWGSLSIMEDSCSLEEHGDAKMNLRG